MQRCSEAEMKHDEIKLMLATATCQNYWWTHLVDRNEHLQKLGFKAEAELVLRVQKFNHCLQGNIQTKNPENVCNMVLEIMRWLMGPLVQDPSLPKRSWTKLSPNPPYLSYLNLWTFLSTITIQSSSFLTKVETKWRCKKTSEGPRRRKKRPTELVTSKIDGSKLSWSWNCGWICCSPQRCVQLGTVSREMCTLH